MTVNSRVLQQNILGSRRFSNYLWAVIVTMGGLGFLLSRTF